MVPRIQRLRARDDVLAVIRGGKTVTSSIVVMHIRSRGVDSRGVRTAVVVGKKVSPSAVRRHRIQRQLREIIKLDIVRHTQGSWDIVWVAKPNIRTVPSFEELRRQLVRPIQQLIAIVS